MLSAFTHLSSLLILVYTAPVYSGFLTEVDKGLVDLVASPQNDIVIVEGGRAQFNCSATKNGHALSTTWLKDGQAILAQDNISLSIDNVTADDQGVYACIVKVEEGSVLTGNANLYLATVPHFSVQPTHTIAYAHHPTRLDCHANAKPNAQYLWMKDGMVINADKRFVFLESGPLQILNVRLEDAGEYKCIAVNHIANATSSPATLTVLQKESVDADKVVSVIVGPRNESVVRGKDAFFECLFDAPSSIQFDWKRIGAIMPSDAEYVGTNLLIRDVQIWDEGTYACMTKHQPSGKTIEWKAELNVIEVPKFFERPQDLSVRRGVTARFRCYVEGQPAPEIKWLYNGYPIKIGGRVKVFPESYKPVVQMDAPLMRTYTRDLVISSVQPEDVGIYQCVVSNPITTISAAAALTFIGDMANDNGPYDLNVRMSQSEKTMKISWRPPKHMAVDVYIIHFYKTNNGRENTHSAIDACVGGICRSDCCPAEELQAHTNYTFRVSGVTYSGAKFSAPSESVVALTWDSYARSVAPLTVTGLTESSLRLEWQTDKLTPDKLPGTVTEFQLQYSSTGAEGIKRMQFPAHVKQYILLELEPGATYKFRVLIKTNAGYPPSRLLNAGLTYPWIQYRLGGNAQPLMAPTLQTVIVNSTTVSVLWTPHGDIVPAGYALVYQLLSPPSGQLSQPHVLKAAKDARSILITGLAPYSLYEISIAALSESGKAGSRSTQAVRTPPSPTPLGPVAPAGGPMPPLDIQCQPISPSRLILRWLTPPSSISIVGYTVRYHLVFEEHHPKPDVILPEETVSVKQAAFEATMLSPGRTYSFAIRSRDKYGIEGPYSVEFACQTPLSGAAPGVVKDVHLSFINKTALLVQWNPPSNFTVVLSYIVEYTFDDPNTSVWNKVIVNGSRTHLVLGDLRVSVMCFVRISARSVDGLGPSTHIFSLSWTSPQSPGIVGALIGVVVALLCLLLLVVCCCKTRYHANHCCFVSAARNGRADESKPNGHIANGRLPTTAPLSEVHELQTLLPPLMENVECDAKGGEEGVRPRCSRIIAVPSVNGLQPNVSTSHIRSQQTEEVPVAVDVALEVCSDTSHSPAATASSLHSWSVHEDHSSNSSQCRHSCSMPNLADSGIGFDECHSHMLMRHRLAQDIASPHSAGRCCHSPPPPPIRCTANCEHVHTSTAHSAAEVVRINPRLICH